MRERCYNTKNNRYHRYGGRGIKVCARWRNSFENFLQDMGHRPKGLTLDRENTDGDYTPGNCRWATRETQARDSRHEITFNGQTLSVQEWADQLGIKQSTLSMRLTKYGWSVERALTTATGG